MLERRRAQLLERLVQLRARLKAGRERADGYTRSLMEHDREAAEHDLSWIERLIASERSGAGPRGAEISLSRTSPAGSRRRPDRGHQPQHCGLRPAISQEDNTT